MLFFTEKSLYSEVEGVFNGENYLVRTHFGKNLSEWNELLSFGNVCAIQRIPFHKNYEKPAYL